jgi:hypothetical protein
MDRQPGARVRIARMLTHVLYSELRLPYVLARRVFFFFLRIRKYVHYYWRDEI